MTMEKKKTYMNRIVILFMSVFVVTCFTYNASAGTIIHSPKTPVTGQPVTFRYIETETEHMVWNFGDGQQKAFPNKDTAQHTYSKEGTYVVKMWDQFGDWGGSPTATTTIIVKAKVKKGSISFRPKNPKEGEEVTFSMRGFTSSCVNVDFGDGKQAKGSSSSQLSHRYSKPGSYEIKMYGDCGKELSGRTTLKVQKLNRKLVVAKNQVKVGEPVIFTTRDFASCVKWDFGDGQTINRGKTKETHSFKKAGMFTVKAYDQCGSSGIKAESVRVKVLDEGLMITDVTLKINDSQKVAEVGLKDPLPSQAVIRYKGKGVLTYQWLLDHQPVGGIKRRQLANNGKVTLKAPSRLLTNKSGSHNLSLKILGYKKKVKIPALSYLVDPALTGKTGIEKQVRDALPIDDLIKEPQFSVAGKPQILWFYFDPAEITLGEKTKLHYKYINGGSRHGDIEDPDDPGKSLVNFTGKEKGEGVLELSPRVTYNYLMFVSGSTDSQGSTAKWATIVVRQPKGTFHGAKPKISKFSANPAVITQGDRVDFTYEYEACSEVYQYEKGKTPTTNDLIRVPEKGKKVSFTYTGIKVEKTTTFVLKAVNRNGSVSRECTVKVIKSLPQGPVNSPLPQVSEKVSDRGIIGQLASKDAGMERVQTDKPSLKEKNTQSKSDLKGGVLSEAGARNAFDPEKSKDLAKGFDNAFNKGAGPKGPMGEKEKLPDDDTMNVPGSSIPSLPGTGKGNHINLPGTKNENSNKKNGGKWVFNGKLPGEDKKTLPGTTVPGFDSDISGSQGSSKGQKEKKGKSIGENLAKKGGLPPLPPMEEDNEEEDSSPGTPSVKGDVVPAKDNTNPTTGLPPMEFLDEKEAKPHKNDTTKPVPKDLQGIFKRPSDPYTETVHVNAKKVRKDAAKFICQDKYGKTVGSENCVKDAKKFKMLQRVCKKKSEIGGKCDEWGYAPVGAGYKDYNQPLPDNTVGPDGTRKKSTLNSAPLFSPVTKTDGNLVGNTTKQVNGTEQVFLKNGLKDGATNSTTPKEKQSQSDDTYGTLRQAQKVPVPIPGKLGDRCYPNTCDTGRCVDYEGYDKLGRCVPKDDFTLKGGQYCHHDNHCKSGFCLGAGKAHFVPNWRSLPDGGGSLSKCAAQLKNGERCYKNRDCQTGQCADDWRCTPVDTEGQPGEYCHHSEHCSSRMCVCPDGKIATSGFCRNYKNYSELEVAKLTRTRKGFYCMSKLPLGAPCKRDEECGGRKNNLPAKCRESICVPKDGTGITNDYCHHGNHCRQACICGDGTRTTNGWCKNWESSKCKIINNVVICGNAGVCQ